MTNIVSFPGLNLEFALNPVAFSIGNFEVRWYGVIIALGIILALFYGFSLAEKRYGLEENRVINVVIGGIIGAIVGARAYYVAFSWSDYKDNLSEIFNIRGGGLAIYGGLIGALLVGIIMCKICKVEIAPMLDLAALGFLIGQGIGRWGNFVNNEAFGCNTTLPWGMTSDTIKATLERNVTSLAEHGITIDPSLPVHPTFLYESLWCLLGFLVLHIYSKHRKFDGEIFALYLAWYGFGRFFIEGLRTDSLYIPGTSLRVSQLLAGVLVIASIIFLIVVKIRRRLNPYGVKPLYVETFESKEIIDNAKAKEKSKKSSYTPLERTKQRKNTNDTPLSVGNIIRGHEGEALDIDKQQLDLEVDKIIEEFSENKGE